MCQNPRFLKVFNPFSGGQGRVESAGPAECAPPLGDFLNDSNQVLTDLYIASTVPWGAGSTSASGASPAPQLSRCDRVVDAVACFGHNFDHIFDLRKAWDGVCGVWTVQETSGAFDFQSSRGQGCLRIGQDGAKMVQDRLKMAELGPKEAPR